MKSNLDLVQTAPNVTYEILEKDGSTIQIHNPQDVPDTGQIVEFRQPIVHVNFLPTDNIGSVMQLCTDRRGIYVKTEYLSPIACDADIRSAAGRSDLRSA